VVSNTGLRPFYDAWLATPIVVQAGAFEIAKPLVLWVNDGLMAVFFFMVGLEIKREVIKGQLSTFDQAALPLAAAVGGMALPALVFVAFNAGNAATIDGWAIPAATDIAFALGILALLGTRAPLALKVFLLAIAIIDDLGAIVIIALFYTADLSVASLLIGGAGLAVLVAFNRLGVASVAAYVLVGLVVWVGVLKSGVHATLAGVLVALTIPMQARHGGHVHSPLEHLIHGLHPWVAFMILPIFAFANAGVAVAGLSLADLASPLPLGIALGLFVGKQIGVLGFTWLAVRSRLCRLPRGVDWAQIYGVACLCGVGFTMSLFIGTLAFDDAALMDGVRLGVLMGSSLSAVVGYLVLRGVAARRTVGATLPA
jgi:Na+:H+ antiporter, NhaA family